MVKFKATVQKFAKGSEEEQKAEKMRKEVLKKAFADSQLNTELPNKKEGDK